METTFITIHDLTPEARILYTSDSIVDVLGYSPEDVVNHSCWEYFHPHELPLAQAKHGHGVALDKAAMLNYCRMKDRDGNYVGCEVVFTVVYDVIVGCTSIYRRGLRSDKRAAEAPVVRRLFSTSPKDPRYHMLSHLSSKFASASPSQDHEPRAALFLNRFTRTLTIMYATNGLSDILGMSGEDMKGKSFYYCIQENCLQDAIRCLENAKSNDSIAYLRFWFRDPRQDGMSDSTGSSPHVPMDTDQHSSHYTRSSDDDHDGNDFSIRSRRTGAHPVPGLERRDRSSYESQAVSSDSSVEPMDTSGQNLSLSIQDSNSRGSSGDSNPFTHEAVFGSPEQHYSSVSSASRSSHGGITPIELEAVVSCTSDGLVVCLRRAKAGTPLSALARAEESYPNGLFAVPWATNPILPPPPTQAPPAAHSAQPKMPPLPPLAVAHPPPTAPTPSEGPPRGSEFMDSIRDIAVFAWALVGINGSLASYSSGSPRGESQPAAGLPIWQPDPNRERGLISSNTNPEPRSNGYHPVRDCQTAFLRPSIQGNTPVHGTGSTSTDDPSTQMFGAFQAPASMPWTAPTQPPPQQPSFRQPFQQQ